MVAVRVKTFEDIYNSVLRRIKIPTTDTESLNAVKESVNTRYESIVFRKKWRWRRTQFDIVVPALYNTGTVAATNGSRQFVGTGTVWTAEMVGWFIEAGAKEETYKVVAIDVAAQTLELSATFQGTTNAAASYTLFKYEHGLPPDCEELDLVWHGHRRYPLDLTSPRELKELLIKNPGAEGWATACTVEGFKDYSGPLLGEFLLLHDFLGGTQKDDLKLLTYPHIPDTSYVLHIDYMIKVDALDADSDEPLIPLEKRHILVYGALSDMFLRERADDTGRFWEAKFTKELEEMEADSEFTDERPRLIVTGKWWRKRRRFDPESADLGSWFDRHYTPYDD